MKSTSHTLCSSYLVSIYQKRYMRKACVIMVTNEFLLRVFSHKSKQVEERKRYYVSRADLLERLSQESGVTPRD